MGKLFEELKRRKVFRVAAVYAVVAWVLIQVADVVLPTFGTPEWVNQTIIFLFLLGFIPTLIAAWAYELTPQGIKPDAQVQSPAGVQATRAQPINYIILIVVLAVAGIQVYDRVLQAPEQELISQPTSSVTTRLSVNLPPEEAFAPARGDFDIAPDGSFFVYLGVDPQGSARMLWLREFNSLNATPIPNTEGATRPKISPDGIEVLFQSRFRIQAVNLQNGLARTLVDDDADVPNWSPDGSYVFYTKRGGEGIHRVTAQGNSSERITQLDTANGEEDHVMVEVLPPGNRIVYQARGVSGNTIQAFNLETNETKILAPGRYPIYLNSGHLIFQDDNERNLLIAEFDTERLEFTSEQRLLADNLYPVGLAGAANVAVSNTGRLLYRRDPLSNSGIVPTWIDRQGIVAEVESGFELPMSTQSISPAISPDGNRLALEVGDQQGTNIWVKYLNEGPFSRVTFEGIRNERPRWSNDGTNLLYVSGGSNSKTVWTRRADGSGSAEPVLITNDDIAYATYTPDEQFLLYVTSADIYFTELSNEPAPRPLIQTQYFEGTPTVSPNGKWIAYSSSESGQYEVYVRPFPEVDAGRWLVSIDGGHGPIWAKNGEELFYINGDAELVSVIIREGESFAWDSQESLFSVVDYQTDARPFPRYDVSPDGQRFVFMRTDSNAELILVDNLMNEMSL